MLIVEETPLLPWCVLGTVLENHLVIYMCLGILSSVPQSNVSAFTPAAYSFLQIPVALSRVLKPKSMEFLSLFFLLKMLLATGLLCGSITIL